MIEHAPVDAAIVLEGARRQRSNLPLGRRRPRPHRGRFRESLQYRGDDVQRDLTRFPSSSVMDNAFPKSSPSGRRSRVEMLSGTPRGRGLAQSPMKASQRYGSRMSPSIVPRRQPSSPIARSPVSTMKVPDHLMSIDSSSSSCDEVPIPPMTRRLNSRENGSVRPSSSSASDVADDSPRYRRTPSRGHAEVVDAVSPLGSLPTKNGGKPLTPSNRYKKAGFRGSQMHDPSKSLLGDIAIEDEIDSVDVVDLPSSDIPSADLPPFASGSSSPSDLPTTSHHMSEVESALQAVAPVRIIHDSPVSSPSASSASSTSRSRRRDPRERIREVPPEQWDYRKGEMIGAGATSQVFIAFCHSEGFSFVVKEISLEGCSGSVLAQKIRAIRNEINFVKLLNHPNVIEYYGVHREGKNIHILMEYVGPGGSITTVLEKFGNLKEKLARRYTLGILQGLAYLHANNVIHRDIKPANVLVQAYGGVKLADFGCSSLIEQDREALVRRTFVGTPNYMAPEVVRCEPYDQKADIWSVACCVYEMCTGVALFPSESPTAVMTRIGNEDAPLPTFPRDFSSELKDFLKQCLNRNPRRRPSAKRLLMHPWLSHEYQLLKSVSGPAVTISERVESSNQSSMSLDSYSSSRDPPPPAEPFHPDPEQPQVPEELIFPPLSGAVETPAHGGGGMGMPSGGFAIDESACGFPKVESPMRVEPTPSLPVLGEENDFVEENASSRRATPLNDSRFSRDVSCVPQRTSSPTEFGEIPSDEIPTHCYQSGIYNPVEDPGSKTFVGRKSRRVVATQPTQTAQAEAAQATQARREPVVRPLDDGAGSHVRVSQVLSFVRPEFTDKELNKTFQRDNRRLIRTKKRQFSQEARAVLARRQAGVRPLPTVHAPGVQSGIRSSRRRVRTDLSGMRLARAMQLHQRSKPRPHPPVTPNVLGLPKRQRRHKSDLVRRQTNARPRRRMTPLSPPASGRMRVVKAHQHFVKFGRGPRRKARRSNGGRQ